MNTCDKILKHKYEKDLRVCDKSKPMKEQSLIEAVWSELEGLALVKAELMRQMIELDEELYKNF